MRLLALTLVLALSAGSAHAFGTINSKKQTAEHEKITRRALACPGEGSDNICFEARTLDQIAGAKGSFGAVGYPDSSSAIFRSEAHCDNGDAPGALEACRAWMKAHLDQAVADAARLLDAQGRISASATRLTPGCVWAFNLKGRAKCDVIQEFGIVLHAAQDFYSHSNWVDDPRDTPAPGLGNRSPSPFIDLRTYGPVPKGLVSGCFSVWGKCGDRVGHETLNKDNGPIGSTIGPGITLRGASHNNFKAAVEAATLDTVDKWALLRWRLEREYGKPRAALMICALTHDNPVSAC